jgi:hypothetical protein
MFTLELQNQVKYSELEILKFFNLTIFNYLLCAQIF